MRSARTFALAFALAACALSSAARADDDYPSSTIRIVVPVPPGGPLDFTARLLSEHLSRAGKQPVIVENRPGAATLLATRAVAAAQPDGYTLLLSSSSLSSYSAFFKDPKIDVGRDLAFVSIVARIPQFLAVTGERPFRSVADMVAYSKANPGRLNYATYGNANRVMTELLNKTLGLQGTHIPYPGGAPAVQALARGEVDYILEAMSTLRPLLASQKLKVLAVYEPNRVPALPAIPTMEESGYRLPDFGIWYGLAAPAGTPKPVLGKLSREVGVFAGSPEAKAKLGQFGFVATSSSPEDFRDTVLAGQAIFLEMAKELGIPRE